MHFAAAVQSDRADWGLGGDGLAVHVEGDDVVGSSQTHFLWLALDKGLGTDVHELVVNLKFVSEKQLNTTVP